MSHGNVRRAINWLALAGVVGFSMSGVFSMVLQMKRAVFLLPYVGGVSAFLVAYFRAHPLSKRELVASWRWGVLAAAVASAFLIRNIQAQPASEVPEGLPLAGAVLWTGMVYGLVDALFLNVMPVLAVYRSWPLEGVASLATRAGRGFVALMASLSVAAAYHLGYVEFQGLAVLPVLLGNAIITATYLLTRSPVAPIMTHVAMHVAAVLHGMETTLQLPPHY